MSTKYFYLFFFLPTIVFCQKTAITNVRMELNQVNPEIVIKYDLISKNPRDSIYVVIRGNQKKIKANALSGILGYNAPVGNDNTIVWKFLEDGVGGKQTIESEVKYYHATLFSGANGKIKLVGLIGGVAGGIYSGVLAKNIKNDISLYNSMPVATSDFAQRELNIIQNRINKNKTTFHIVSGLTLGIVITDFFFLRKAQKRLNQLR